jgi:hypothetical protein
MAASRTKTILFARAAEGKTVHQWPVAVFNAERDARGYVAFLRLAQKSGNGDLLLQLDPSFRKDESGAVLKDAKWSLAEVPYAPSPDTEDDETESTGTSPVS